MIKTGLGYDIHPFVQNKALVLGGYTIINSKLGGLLGHSDGDVYTHSIIDALLGMCGEGSIGEYYPENDIYKNAKSLDLLNDCIKNLNNNYKFKIHNIDSTIISNSIKIQPVSKIIKENISNIFKIAPNLINIKGKSGNSLGPGGKDEGIEAFTIILGDVFIK